MIMTIIDVAKHLSTLGLADRNHIYCGKMQGKKDNSIGVYNLNRSRAKRETIGGDVNSSYRVKPVSFLMHWDKSLENAEKAAAALYSAVQGIKNVTVNGKRILFTRMLTDEPVDVGTDDSGVYEFVVEADFYYERQE